MGRIPIFDSAATLDSSDGAIDNTLAQNSWLKSRPVRMVGGPEGDQRNISYEFVLSGSPLTAFDFEWYQEFFPDHPWVNIVNALPTGFRQCSIGAYPNERVFPDSGSDYPWAREQNAIAGASGRIDHYNVTRYVTMTVPAAGQADCRWFPMLVQCMWVRLAVRVTTAGTYPRLRIFAHAGGLTDVTEYTEKLSVPFSWSIPEE